jgi:uncharacterized membrane protein
MKKGRLEAFSDGVMAIIITIMVLELHVPDHSNLEALRPLIPTLLCYVLSFIFIGIYWNNHHHLYQAAERVTGATLWANHHLLFWLSLIPFATAWMGGNHFSSIPVALYGVVLLGAGAAYSIMVQCLLRGHATDSRLVRAIGRDVKGHISLALYITGIALSFFNPALACGCYVIVAGMWLIPDRRIERQIGN